MNTKIVVIFGLILSAVVKCDQNSSTLILSKNNSNKMTSTTLTTTKLSTSTRHSRYEPKTKTIGDTYRLITRRGPLIHQDIPVFNFRNYADYSLPSPPRRPVRFRCRQELRDYLIALFNYYSILSRPRFGRRRRDIDKAAAAVSHDDVMRLIDLNGDGLVSKDELAAYFFDFDETKFN